MVLVPCLVPSSPPRPASLTAKRLLFSTSSPGSHSTCFHRPRPSSGPSERHFHVGKQLMTRRNVRVTGSALLMAAGSLGQQPRPALAPLTVGGDLTALIPPQGCWE